MEIKVSEEFKKMAIGIYGNYSNEAIEKELQKNDEENNNPFTNYLIIKEENIC
jgi:hypothetical protein